MKKASLRNIFANPGCLFSLLWVFVPIALILELTHASETAIFVTAEFGIVPLASILVFVLAFSICQNELRALVAK